MRDNTIDYTDPQGSLDAGHSHEAEGLMQPEVKKSLRERVSSYGLRTLVAGTLLGLGSIGADFTWQNYRMSHSPEIVREYLDIDPAVSQLEKAVERSKNNYLFEFDREGFNSTNVVANLDRVQIENSASQYEQLGNLSGLAARLKLRKQEIEEKSPDAMSYMAKTDSVRRHIYQTGAVSGLLSGIGLLMITLPAIYSHIRRKKGQKAQSLAEVCEEQGIPSLGEIKKDRDSKTD